MGDTLFHLLPEIFLGEDDPEKARFVLVEPNRNLLLGVAIMVGFMTFVAMDKGLRIATGGSGGHDHSHGHSHDEHENQPLSSFEAEALSTGVQVSDSKGAKSRNKANGSLKENGNVAAQTKEINPSVKLGGILNMMQVFLAQ